MLCLLSLHAILRLHSASIITKIDIIGMSLLTAVTFFVNPSVGIGVYLASFMLLAYRFSLKAGIYIVVTAAAVLVLVLSPWVIRNRLVMGHVIVLRDNLGLELAVANNDFTAKGPDSHSAWADQMKLLHPSSGGYGRTRLLQVGEFAYLSELQDDAKKWILNNPTRLCSPLSSTFAPNVFPRCMAVRDRLWKIFWNSGRTGHHRLCNRLGWAIFWHVAKPSALEVCSLRCDDGWSTVHAVSAYGPVFVSPSWPTYVLCSRWSLPRRSPVSSS